MPLRRPTARTACRALTALGALPIVAVAAPVAAQTTWLCGLSADAVRLVCVADQDPVVAAHAAHAANAATAVVNGTRFPLDPGGRWVVDLWSPPTEPEAVAQLARATICYRSPDCEVVMAWPAAGAHGPLRTAGR